MALPTLILSKTNLARDSLCFAEQPPPQDVTSVPQLFPNPLHYSTTLNHKHTRQLHTSSPLQSFLIPNHTPWQPMPPDATHTTLHTSQHAATKHHRRRRGPKNAHTLLTLIPAPVTAQRICIARKQLESVTLSLLIQFQPHTRNPAYNPSGYDHPVLVPTTKKNGPIPSPPSPWTYQGVTVATVL